jgi:hypothetical protein
MVIADALPAPSSRPAAPKVSETVTTWKVFCILEQN